MMAMGYLDDGPHEGEFVSIGWPIPNEIVLAPSLSRAGEVQYGAEEQGGIAYELASYDPLTYRRIGR